MAETKNTEICETEDKIPGYRKQIRKTTYIVKVRFSESARETMEQKIQRPSVASGGTLSFRTHF